MIIRKSLNTLFFCIVFLTFAVSNGVAYQEEPDFEELEEKFSSEKEIKNWLNNNMPEAIDYINRLEKEGSEDYEDELFEYGLRIAELEGIKYYNEEYFKLALEGDKQELKSWIIAEKLMVETDPAKRRELSSDLKSVLGKVFDLRLEEKKKEIHEIEKELEELKELVNKREKAKSSIVDRRLSELVQTEDETMEWW